MQVKHSYTKIKINLKDLLPSIKCDLHKVPTSQTRNLSLIPRTHLNMRGLILADGAGPGDVAGSLELTCQPV